MSTATTEKPATPLGSFITKLTPKVDEKPAAKTESVMESSPDVKAEPAAKAESTAKESVASGLKTEETSKAKEPEPDVVEKRLKDTQKWGNEEHKARLAAEQKALDLQARLERIEKKLDGTYEEPQAPSPEQASAEIDMKARIRASHHAAVRQYGQEFVMQTVWDIDGPYQALHSKSPAIRARVMEADDPVLEAIAVVKEHQDGEKYGRTPEEIRKKMEAELTPKLTQDILKSLETKSGAPVRTLGNVRGDSERTSLKSEAPARLDFRSVFPWGASRT